jgi:hypothetical protein
VQERHRAEWREPLEVLSWPHLILRDGRRLIAPDVYEGRGSVELFRLLGGGRTGDLAGLPESQLAVLPGTPHFMPPGSGVLDRAGWMLSMITKFLA